jgi:transcriptional repressor NrdR
MHCPYCDADKESLKVIDSRTCEGGRSIRRRRECLACKKRFTTYERIEDPIRLIVVKRDGRRVPWDRGKILLGLERACFKRAVPESELLRIVDEVEEEVFKSNDREIASTLIGQVVTDRLRRIDQVAYVRFASVYKQFKTLEDLVDEAKAVIDARRFEDPTQGTLFVEPAKKASTDNGNVTPVPPETKGAPAPKKRRAPAAQPVGE